MTISHLLNLAKALLGKKKKKVVPEKQMNYLKTFRHPHTESVFKRGLSSRDSHDPSWQTCWDRLQT